MIYDGLVCYVCQHVHFSPDRCQPVNVIVAGYGVCFRHQHAVTRHLQDDALYNAIISDIEKYYK